MYVQQPQAVQKGSSTTARPTPAASKTPEATASPVTLPPIQSTPVSGQVQNVPPTGGNAPVAGRFTTDYEFWLSISILLFGLVVIGFQFILGRSKNFAAEDTLRVFAVTLILIGTLVLIAAGFSTNQISPAFGLFGTIAGYLLGKRAGMNERIIDQHATEQQPPSERKEEVK